jgi:hypothetical protein
MEDEKLEEAMAENVEKSFNDDELQDIMDEIETLEKEFVEEPNAEAPQTDTNLALSEAKENSIQEAIDKEVATIGEEIVSEAKIEASEEIAQAELEEPLGDFEEEVSASSEVETEEVLVSAVEEAVSEAPVESDQEIADVDDILAESDNVVELTPAATTTSSTSTQGSNMDFSAQGNMNLNLNFSIGEETGTLIVNEDQGLKVSVSGVEFHISEETGCVVEMPGGIKFEIPLTAASSSSTKKAA